MWESDTTSGSGSNTCHIEQEYHVALKKVTEAKSHENYDLVK
jgi:hypothetical protein